MGAPGSPGSRRGLTGSPSSIERAVGRLSLTSRRSNSRRSRTKGIPPAADDGVDEWGKTAPQRVRSHEYPSLTVFRHMKVRLEACHGRCVWPLSFAGGISRPSVVCRKDAFLLSATPSESRGSPKSKVSFTVLGLILRSRKVGLRRTCSGLFCTLQSAWAPAPSSRCRRARRMQMARTPSLTMLVKLQLLAHAQHLSGPKPGPKAPCPTLPPPRPRRLSVPPPLRPPPLSGRLWPSPTAQTPAGL